MKKLIAFALCLSILLLSAGCGGASGTQEEVPVTVTEASAGVDVDLTKLSSTMVYSEVYNMMNTPTDYIGKTVKAKGPFAVYHDEENDNYFFAVRITDATACCAQGLEFVWKGAHKYPEGYPPLDTEIIVEGTFRDYMDGTQKYYHLEDASLVISH